MQLYAPPKVVSFHMVGDLSPLIRGTYVTVGVGGSPPILKTLAPPTEKVPELEI